MAIWFSTNYTVPYCPYCELRHSPQMPCEIAGRLYLAMRKAARQELGALGTRSTFTPPQRNVKINCRICSGTWEEPEELAQRGLSANRLRWESEAAKVLSGVCSACRAEFEAERLKPVPVEVQMRRQRDRIDALKAAHPEWALERVYAQAAEDSTPERDAGFKAYLRERAQ